ncbi:hypothetical protein CW696_07655 [ANME-2 cluster archaeon]|nr:MAG: hypothetical protein CW696_07655 [ANME-2 cluster archaeon]
MSIGVNTLTEALIELGACDGLDKSKCAKATMKMISLGEKGKPFARRIMGEDFEKFRTQWRRAFEKFEKSGNESPVEEKTTTHDLWEDISAEIE